LKGLESDPNQSGKFYLEVGIGPSGAVDWASVVHPSGWATPVARCIESVARRVKFDPPAERYATVTVPLELVPAAPATMR